MGIYLKHAYFNDRLINFPVIPENCQRVSAFDYTREKIPSKMFGRVLDTSLHTKRNLSKDSRHRQSLNELH